MSNTNNRLLDLKKLKFEIRDAMRYDDVGDYFGNTIVAYDFKDDIVTNAIFLHEFIEYTLIKSSGIDPKLIDKFDTDPTYMHKFPREYALYGKYHSMANMIEQQFVENLGLNWTEYEKSITTTEVKIAMQDISDEMHKEKPDNNKIERLKKIVKNVLEKK